MNLRNVRECPQPVACGLDEQVAMIVLKLQLDPGLILLEGKAIGVCSDRLRHGDRLILEGVRRSQVGVALGQESDDDLLKD